MTKLILNNVANGGPTGITSINSNNDLIEVALENTLSRDGTSPNQMAADLDMDNNDILNVKSLQIENLIFQGTDFGDAVERAEAAAESAEEDADRAEQALEDLLMGSIPDNSVSTVKLQNNAVTEPKLDSSLTLTLSPVVTTTALIKGVNTSRYNTVYCNHANQYGVFKWLSGDQSSKLVTRTITSTAFSDASDTFTLTNHGLHSMEPVTPSANVNGLFTTSVYYIVRVDANTFKIATSIANARSGTGAVLTITTNVTLYRLKDPIQGVYVTPTGSPITGTSGCWERQTDTYNVRMLGAVGNNSTDDLDAFQHASNFGGFWHLEAKSYRITNGISYYQNGYGLIGQGMYKSVINYTPTTGQVFFNPWFGTTTMVEGIVWKDLQITSANITTSGASIIALKNVQRWHLERVYFYGAQINGTYLVDAQGNWPLGTYYGAAISCVFGLSQFGFYGGDGFNNNRLQDCRFQSASPGGGQGLTILPTVAGFSSVNRVDHCSFELPGNTMTGMYVNNVTGLTIDDCRFESLSTGLFLLSGSKHVELRNPYFESTTTKVSNSSVELRPVVRAAATFSGVTTVAYTGQRFGCTITRSTTGTYAINFTEAFSLADYQISFSTQGSFDVEILSQQATFCTFVTRSRTTTNIEDCGNVNVTVSGAPA